MTPAARRRCLLAALTALSAVLVVSCLGDDRFTGKALLTIAVVSATAYVLVLDLAAPNRTGATP